MFEKDIYQLIRGLRAHKGAERAYIAASLRECRREITTADPDAKTAALLKLVYLEMFGHDMSWAAFHVLEVMASPRYPQKRVGYLAAVQSFRPDTEVLVLAENLLKKDLNSGERNTVALPLGAISHILNPGMAASVVGDLVPKLAHPSAGLRKKTVVALYRTALVYPETLRVAWPRIRERLLDEEEDPSVTAATVNVVCELAWRRPRDFLPLAPRLFELLTVGGNNWMAIKIIKLFSVLTPVEPRLVKKLLPPLTTLMKTTPAMSLLYECINGIIQGGIMEAAEGTTEGDEVARLCVGKLRSMLVLEGDPNLRYVALLAMAKITSSHADLVSDHQDVILECIDDADVSIRTRALDIVVGMINANNLQTVVERLLKQLRNAGRASIVSDPAQDRGMHEGIVPMADDDDEDMQATIRPKEPKSAQAPPLPEDYRTSVIERILEMCSRDNYANLNDFEWYIDVLVDLVKQCPAAPASGGYGSHTGSASDGKSTADAVGAELLNVVVRVKGVRPEAAAAAQSLLLVERREQMFPSAGNGGQGVLSAAAFIAGEYANMLPDPETVLNSLVDSTSAQLPPNTLASYLQAIPKIFAVLTSDQMSPWTSARQSQVILLVARIVHFLEPLTLHPSLDVQERAVEYLDLMRLASEAASAHSTEADEPPLLLTQAIPSLFMGMELKPVAVSALSQVPLPADLDLDEPINGNLQMLLRQADYDTDFDEGADEVYKFYHEKPSAAVVVQPKSASEVLDTRLDTDSDSRKAERRRERNKDDPYYIDSTSSGASTPMHHILRNANGPDLDVDAIPVMELKLDTAERPTVTKRAPSAKKPKRRFEVEADETLGDALSAAASLPPPTAFRGTKKSLLEVDSSGLSALSLERGDEEEEEMARAVKEVERLRLEMQRQQERIEAPEEGTVVRRKPGRRKKVVVADAVEAGEDGGGEVVMKKKKKKKIREANGERSGEAEAEEAEVVEAKPKKKKKKKREVTLEEEG